MDIKLTPFTVNEFAGLISWVDSEKLMTTIAGKVFTFPLTADQLHKYLSDVRSTAYNIVNVETGQVIGHAELVESETAMLKIDKLLIGDSDMRGKGIGGKVIRLLLMTAFNRSGIDVVELNVFDWNIAGIRCYEKCGFRFNMNKTQRFVFEDEEWTTLNMSIGRKAFESAHRSHDRQD